MATLAQRGAGAEGTRFYTIMAFVMALVIVAGFSLNLAMGRSSFALPPAFHLHGVIFMGWLGLYLAQRLGIPLAEIGEALKILPDDRAPSAADWKILSQQWRQELDARIEQLTLEHVAQPQFFPSPRGMFEHQ